MNTATPLLLIFLAYVAVVATAGWFVLGSDRRTSIHKRMRSGAACGLACFRNGAESLIAAPRIVIGRMACMLFATTTSAWRHRQMIGIGMLLFGTPVMMLLTFADLSRWHSYADMAPQRDLVVATLLAGEQLIPPTMLPPETFTTREASSDRNELATASREWMLLDPDFRQRLLLVFRAMERHGYRMALLEGYRSAERQQILAQLGPHISNAKAYQSYHQFGLAADSAFYRDGRLIISEKDPWAMEGYRLYGEYAESVGLTWGGRWQMRDFGHVELRRTGTLR